MSRLIQIALSCLLVACSEQQSSVTLHPADRIPERLSEWGLVISDGRTFTLNEAALPYELNTPLFSDYALKIRSVWMPDGESAAYDANREFDFPVGTILSKTFHYEKASGWSDTERRVVQADRESSLNQNAQLDLEDYDLIETRLLVHYEDGWRAYPYVWNRAQDEAWLEIAGDVAELTLVNATLETDILYVVPDSNQCAGCHAPDHSGGAILPIGTKARHLNRDGQIEHWQKSGVLRGVDGKLPRAARWLVSDDGSTADRARAYLDINCAHCHNSVGAADTSGLHLNIEARLDRNFGICKSPTAVGQGSGNRLYDIYPGKPEESILIFRMDHTDPAIAMPELGRSTIHVEGVTLLTQWIAGLDGDC